MLLSENRNPGKEIPQTWEVGSIKRITYSDGIFMIVKPLHASDDMLKLQRLSQLTKAGLYDRFT